MIILWRFPFPVSPFPFPFRELNRELGAALCCKVHLVIFQLATSCVTLKQFPQQAVNCRFLLLSHVNQSYNSPTSPMGMGAIDFDSALARPR